MTALRSSISFSARRIIASVASDICRVPFVDRELGTKPSRPTSARLRQMIRSISEHPMVLRAFQRCQKREIFVENRGFTQRRQSRCIDQVFTTANIEGLSPGV